MRVIRCDCGFEASDEADDELVSQAQLHAREAHDMDLPAELVLTLARSDARRPPDDPGTEHP